MAVSGLVMVGFLIVHLAGNLLVFAGPASYNSYAAKLKAVPLLVWGVRGMLLAALIVHVVAAFQLMGIASAGRPVAYARHETEASTLASRTMKWGGIALLIFIVLHLLHFTTGTIHPDFRAPDVHHNVITSFAKPVISGLYLLAMFALGMHLYHGTWSVFQTMGVNNPTVGGVRKKVAGALAILLYVGFSLIPLGIMLGFARGR